MSQLTRADIEALIPHRAPILIPETVEAWSPDATITTTRLFPKNDPLFTGHFPGNPILPGVLLVEGMAQSAALLVSLTKGLNARNALYLFMGVEDTRFKKTVTPGTQVTFNLTQQSEKLGIYKFTGEALVEGTLIARTSITAKLIIQQQA